MAGRWWIVSVVLWVVFLGIFVVHHYQYEQKDYQHYVVSEKLPEEDVPKYPTIAKVIEEVEKEVIPEEFPTEVASAPKVEIPKMLLPQPIIEYYDNGVKKATGTNFDDKAHGHWNFYHQNGMLAKEGGLVA